MTKVLIIDDDNQRTREICSEIKKDNLDIEVASNKHDALTKMTHTQFDLVILDIMLPDDNMTVALSNGGGVALLNEIETTRMIKKPHNIIGITSGKDIYDQYFPLFNSKLIPLLLWEFGNTVWKEQFKNKIEYLIKIDRQKPEVIKADIALITAVDDEYSAVLSLFESWNDIYIPDDPSIYKITQWNINGCPKNILLVKLPEMGISAASCFTTKIIKTFSPNQIYMIGICGGIKEEVNLGDIIVANCSWDYGSGKIKPPKDEDENKYYELEASPNQVSINPITVSVINTYKDKIIAEIKEEWKAMYPDDDIAPSLHIGPMPSGAAVVSYDAIFAQLIKPQHRKCLGLDMETYGVYFAIKNTTNNVVDFCTVKCVSDYANAEKNDDYHKVCCFTSAKFILKYIEYREQA